MKICKDVILLTSHVISKSIFSQYQALKIAVSEQTDLFLLLEDIGVKIQFPADIQAYTFSEDTIEELKYTSIEETLIPGSNHFPVLQFYRDFPDYETYWNIEYDVYFHGDWRVFFYAFENIKADFISSHIEYFRQRPYWYWWNTLHLKTLSIPQSAHIKSFNPIYRISNKALSYLHKVLCAQNYGHHEALIPTVLNNAGFSLLDYGGIGNFTPQEFKNRFYNSVSTLDDYYSNTTMRFRPPYDREKIENTPCDNQLYHPVKF